MKKQVIAGVALALMLACGLTGCVPNYYSSEQYESTRSTVLDAGSQWFAANMKGASLVSYEYDVTRNLANYVVGEFTEDSTVYNYLLNVDSGQLLVQDKYLLPEILEDELSDLASSLGLAKNDVSLVNANYRNGDSGDYQDISERFVYTSYDYGTSGKGEYTESLAEFTRTGYFAYGTSEEDVEASTRRIIELGGVKFTVGVDNFSIDGDSIQKLCDFVSDKLYEADICLRGTGCILYIKDGDKRELEYRGDMAESFPYFLLKESYNLTKIRVYLGDNYRYFEWSDLNPDTLYEYLYKETNEQKGFSQIDARNISDYRK